MNDIYVLSVDMEDRRAEDIARDAATQIIGLLQNRNEHNQRIDGY